MSLRGGNKLIILWPPSAGASSADSPWISGGLRRLWIVRIVWNPGESFQDPVLLVTLEKECPWITEALVG